MSGKKSPQYSRHNFDKFRHSFMTFGMNLNVLKHQKILPNPATWLHGDDVISDVIKNVVCRQRRTFNQSFSKGKNVTVRADYSVTEPLGN